jgi:multisubunit Na+/H+ antiporter MnhG subunit
MQFTNIESIRKSWLLRAAALVAAAFGIVTIHAGGSVLFGDGAAAAGNYVPYVLWFNFIAGFAYVAAAIGLWRARRWGAWTAIAIAGATALVFAVFGIHVASGGAFETRTVWAMTLRTVLWTAIAALAWRKGCRDEPVQAH